MAAIHSLPPLGPVFSAADLNFEPEFLPLPTSTLDSDDQRVPLLASLSSTRSRKSKSQALSKLAAVTDSGEGASKKSAPVPELPMPKDNPGRQFLAKPRSKPLDTSDICTRAPRTLPNRANRPFGLEHCPVFHPTVDEFAQPLEYIESIVQKCGKQYGIVKIVPPDQWRPPFSLNSETFRFKTRLQRLNSMEASARASLTFLEQLYVFHRQQKGPKVTIPIIDGKKVDLWRLRKTVNEIGGYRSVTRDRKWPQVASAIGFEVTAGSLIPSMLKTAYAKIITPFEHYLDSIKMTNITPLPGDTVKPDAITMHTSVSRMSGGSSSAAITKDVITQKQMEDASAKLDEALNADEDDDAGLDLVTPTTDASATSLTNDKRLLQPGDVCEICHSGENQKQIVLCDECDRGYHLSCLTPALARVPPGDWVCDGCIVSTGTDFGFEQGQEHTLRSYRKRADEFKRQWLAKHRPTKPLAPLTTNGHRPLELDLSNSPAESSINGHEHQNLNGASTEGDYKLPLPPTDDHQDLFAEHLHLENYVEEEFWRLVESQTDTVEVEYGADLHSSKYGSGFPSLERDGLNPYARDGWNLNNLPLLTGSLLRYIRSDIAGMTNPWLYAGMCFSTFAWHKEDHYTYSINYHHFGDTKTWYGAPAADDHILEETIKHAAPELFVQQPDLMFQLVTLLSPARLQAAGVRLAACDQRAGEFVITLPRAYHAGFNHGFNMCEAVNFSMPDWLEHDLACVQHYRQLSKVPVFSHDELMCTIFTHERNPASARWLYPFFREMVERELQRRNDLREAIDGLEEIVEEEEALNETPQCVQCRAYCFLSYVCPALSPSRTTCQDHAQAILGDVKLQMRLRYLDSDLRTFLKRVKTRFDKLNAPPKQPKAPPAPVVIIPEEPLEARKSGRQRIPTIAALEAMGEEALSLAERKKRAAPGGWETPSASSSPKRPRSSEASSLNTTPRTLSTYAVRRDADLTR